MADRLARALTTTVVAGGASVSAGHAPGQLPPLTICTALISPSGARIGGSREG
jgi:hypothetical protein